MINQLQDIKEQLFDAPSEVKESFNKVVNYFSLVQDLRLETKIGKKFVKEFDAFLKKFRKENDMGFEEKQEILESIFLIIDRHF